MIIIEHLEPTVSPWTYYEYQHVAQYYPNILISNLQNAKERALIAELCSVVQQSVKDLPFKKIIVLDPLAPQLLCKTDFIDSVVVVGGILGNYPPESRTQKLLSSQFSCEIRNLGEGQLPIDAAVYVAAEIEKGRAFNDINFIDTLEIKQESVGKCEHTISLPYFYPVVDKKPFISQRLLKYLEKEIEEDEETEIRTGKPISIVNKLTKL